MGEVGSAQRDEPPLLVERHAGDVVQFTLNRRHAANTVSFELWDAFAAALGEIERGSPPRALLIAGAGGLFSVGGDVRVPPARGEGALAPATRLEMGQRIIARVRRLPVPVIAAVERGAYGVGWALALSADLIFAGEDAGFGAPFLEYGTVPDGGIAWFLERAVGRYRAADLIFSGRTIQAPEALSLGLVSRVTAPGQAVAEALAFAGAIGKGNRRAAELAKRQLHGAAESGLEAAFAQELAYCAICQTGEEVAEAKREFERRAAERKAPVDGETKR